MAHSDRYETFAALARKEHEGRDFRITAVARPGSPVAIVAPHGGAIEKRTAEIARGIAGQEFSYYLFEGTRRNQNYERLHLTSRHFDEPRCLQLVQASDVVVTVHGCEDYGGQIYAGGLDSALVTALSQALTAAGLTVAPPGHEFDATDPVNICNRSRLGRGVQLELPRVVRGGPFEARCVRAVRQVLLARFSGTMPSA